ncbi:MAG: 1-deoxy-D-xylulose-5-phosphate synthase [Candidatus Omnitrophica bacterium]|nr:1-deoxy-D-xylulose-5-phosphate synthase [Candidatus Omnitrophota bacterium]
MVLENIHKPQDIKSFSIEQLAVLSSEIRARILDVVSRNGGHLASSLGAVEIIVALHYCLDTPKDKIVFDVGHQAYAHKILTGRNKQFDTLRQMGGISGFPCKEESVYDPFTTGHSSSAVSLALGLACAREHLNPQEYYKVAAVIGDGSLSGGLCFEGLNNAGHCGKDILVVLNTNDLSISPNAGSISNYLNKLISKPIYNRFKSSLDSFVKSRVPKGSRLLKIANKFEEGLKGLFIPGILFEEIGFRYFGPLDGHNLQTLVPTLKNILNLKGPILLHVVTKKGKGCKTTENEPVKFHGCGPFDVETGKSLSPAKKLSYTDIFSSSITALAKKDSRIIAVCAAMPEGTGLEKFKELFPQRFFDVGIAEEHAVCFAAGLARQGLRPVVAIYSTFLQRAYDQIIEDVALQNLPVIFAVDRAGVVGEDGVTHQGIFDLSYLRHIPNLTVMAPRDAQELVAMLEFSLGIDGPVAIRYPRSPVPEGTLTESRPALRMGKSEVLREGTDFVLVAVGSMVNPAMDAVDILADKGFFGTLVNARFVKPLDTGMLKSLAVKTKLFVTVEEGVIDGGFGSAVGEALPMPIVKLGLPCSFIPHGKRDVLLEQNGLNPQGIVDSIRSCFKNR